MTWLTCLKSRVASMIALDVVPVALCTKSSPSRTSSTFGYLLFTLVITFAIRCVRVFILTSSSVVSLLQRSCSVSGFGAG